MYSVLTYLQASAGTMSCYEANVWCLVAESDKRVQILMVHISHLLPTQNIKDFKAILILRVSFTIVRGAYCDRLSCDVVGWLVTVREL